MNKNKLAIALLVSASLTACSSVSSDAESNSAVMVESPMVSKYDIDGFKTEIEDGRLWVFADSSEELAFFKEHGEPAKQFTNIGAGPEGMTVKASSQATLDGYLASFSGSSKFDIDGFKTTVEDGRLWVFAEGTDEWAFYEEHGEPAKQFTNIGSGPNGMTVKASSQETLDGYLTAFKNQ